MTHVALITGASSGIGQATSRRLAAEPNTELVLVARRAQRLRQPAASLPTRVTYLAADLTDSDAPDRIGTHIQQRHGRLTLLVNNSGASWRATFHDGGHGNVKRTMEPNFDSVHRGVTADAPRQRPERDRQRRQHDGQYRPPGRRRLLGRKFALAGWTDALRRGAPARRARRVRAPRFIATEGFPPMNYAGGGSPAGWSPTPTPRWRRSSTRGLRGRAERYAPRSYGVIAAARVLAPTCSAACKPAPPPARDKADGC